MERQGLLSRVHGGAVSVDKSYYKMDLYQQVQTNQEEKIAIAKQIAAMVEDDDTLMINAGTTTLFVVRELKELKNITIVTNSIPAALEAGEHRNITAILLGGDINARYQFTYGNDTLRKLGEFHADKAILSVDGICAESGISTYYHQEAELCRLMLKRADYPILAADYSKIGRTTLAQIAPVDCGVSVVTNASAPEDEVERLRERAAEVILI